MTTVYIIFQLLQNVYSINVSTLSLVSILSGVFLISVYKLVFQLCLFIIDLSAVYLTLLM